MNDYEAFKREGVCGRNRDIVGVLVLTVYTRDETGSRVLDYSTFKECQRKNGNENSYLFFFFRILFNFASNSGDSKMSVA